jgi:predicted nucleotidyltransferase
MRDIDTLAREMKLNYFLCGAMARDILLWHVHGIKTGRATSDVDFAVAVEDWKQFDEIKTRLTETRKFKTANKMEQRLYYSPGIEGIEYPLDIIPFGNVEDPRHSIAWPMDTELVMNVAGYDEALEAVVEIEIEDQFVIPVISLPGLTLLKLFAWMDRGGGNTKDALDLATLLNNYGHAGNSNRLYDQEFGLFEAAEFDMSIASPILLGKDVRSIAEPETLAKALAIIDDPNRAGRLATHMAPQFRQDLDHNDDPILKAERLLENFKRGLQKQ